MHFRECSRKRVLDRNCCQQVVAALLVLLLLAVAPSFSHAERRYLGVGTCSSSNCHGSVSPKKSTNVLQNEFVTWFKHDKHSGALKALYGEDAKRIALNLGIGDPWKEKECLDCHALNVPEELRGERFSIEDGVSCESCHGPSEGWIRSHVEKDATHAENLSRGMTDLSSLSNRANLCARCHFGSEERPIDHRIYGAGHPRLTFELDTFEAVGPRHWLLDADYESRKGKYDATKAWLTSQLSQSRLALQKFLKDVGTVPDFSNLYCYSCHHSLEEKQFRTRSYGGHPGAPRLNISHLLIVARATAPIESLGAGELPISLSQLHNPDMVRSGAEKALSEVSRIEKSLEHHALSARDRDTMKQELVALGKSGEIYDYEIAEQIAMGLSALGAEKSDASPMKQVYASLRQAGRFNPPAFAAAVSKIRASE